MSANPFRSVSSYGMSDDLGGVNDPVFDPNSNYSMTGITGQLSGGGGAGMSASSGVSAFQNQPLHSMYAPPAGSGGGVTSAFPQYSGGGGGGVGSSILQTPLSPSQTLVDPELLDVFSLAAAGPAMTISDPHTHSHSQSQS